MIKYIGFEDTTPESRKSAYIGFATIKFDGEFLTIERENNSKVVIGHTFRLDGYTVTKIYGDGDNRKRECYTVPTLSAAFKLIEDKL